MKNKSGWAMLCILLLALHLSVCGCLNRDDQETEFLNRVRDIVWSNGVSVATGCGDEPYAQEARMKGIDLFKAYGENALDRQLRLSLAYLLVGQESEPYLDYAEHHVEELASDYELLLWTHMLCHQQDRRFSKTYQHRMEKILEGVDVPYARLCVAKLLLANGKEALAIDRLLNLLGGEPPWNAEALETLQGMSETRLTSLLLPYLQKESRQSAFAAVALAGVPNHRNAALRFLEDLSKNKDPSLASTGRQALREAEAVAHSFDVERR